MSWLITWDRVGPLGGKGKQLVGQVGEWYVKSRHLQDYSPHLCRLWTDGLAPTSKYWMYRSHASDMGPVSLVACHQQKLGLSLMLHWLAWERNWVRTHGSVSRRAMDCVECPFSREQWDPSKSIDDSWKVATYGDRRQEAYVGRMWTGIESVCVMLIMFSPVGCTSIRITVTLRNE
jgi:hypothetical protein